MSSLSKLLARSCGLALVVFLAVSATFAQQAGGGSLRGQIADEFGGAIVGATVTATETQSGATRTATTNEEGVFVFASLAPGRYVVRATATGFAAYENADVSIVAGQRAQLDVRMGIELEQQEVTVASDSPAVNTEPENNADAVVLRGADIQALPDDPDEMAAALQALAGPSGGPSGGQIYVDGFTGGRLPPRESIREVRINQNPFSAENDRPSGRIEILTRPGTDRFRGGAFFNFEDESLNSRNPFAPNRAPFQVRQFGGNVGGPIVARRASFFLDFDRRVTDENEVINATILDAALNPTRFSQAILTPREFLTFSPRLDYQINPNNTLIARYSFSRNSAANAGIGGFSLLSRAYETENTQHTFQLTETMVISPTVINETRFQFTRGRREQTGDNSVAALNVLEAFFGGGAQIGQSFVEDNRWELQNFTSWVRGTHSFKAGARLRGVSITDVSRNNFGGTYTFAGGTGPLLDANNQVVLENGQPVMVPLTSLERYRRTLFFQQQGRTAAEIRALGGGATQFSLAGGNPEASVRQWDFGGYIQDDWRIRPNFTLSVGLRYENQTNISSNLNFAPRIAIAWSPDGNNAVGGRPPRTVIRGGFGIFYDRLSENWTLQANRFNGVNQQQFIVTDPATLGLFPNVPTIEQLEAFALPQTIRRVADDYQAPHNYMFGMQVERQLPGQFRAFLTVFSFRSRHVPRLVNANAPVPGTGLRPLGNIGEVFQFESSGTFNENRMIVGLNRSFNRGFSIFANYSLGKSESDADRWGFSSPANPYDYSNEYGRDAFDTRHRFFFGGTIAVPYLKLMLNPFIMATSGRPFNITTGRDTNGDRLFTERPSFAQNVDCANPGQNIVCTRFGNFNLLPAPGEQTIPRNFGEGPGFFSVNMRISRAFGFGGAPGGRGAAAAPQGGPPGAVRVGSPAGGPGGQTEQRYNITLSLNIQNMFNRVNAGQPVGNLSSPFFGQSLATSGHFGFGPGGASAAGNRRISAQIRFGF